MQRSFRRNLALSLPVLYLLTFGAVTVATAEMPPCAPCAGVAVDDPSDLLASLASEPTLADDARLFVAWPTLLTDTAAAKLTHQVAERGAVPWLRARFTTPSPVTDNLQQFESELETLSALVRESHETTHFQLEWPAGGDDLESYAFVFKRAAVAVTGARAETRVISQPLAANPAALDAFYANEIAAYADGIALRPPREGSPAAAVDHLVNLDPGTGVALMARATPEPTSRALLAAAEDAADGVAVTFFDLTGPTAAKLAPLKVLANEFRGADLAFDPYSSPDGAWAFVRGEDLALRVLIDRGSSSDRVEFADTTLRQPTQVSTDTGEGNELFGISRTANGLRIPLEGEGAVGILRLARPDLSDLLGEGGLAEEVTITTERTMPVAEILRRLQANEDAQSRALDHYEAVNTTHLRFQGTSGTGQVEATFEGTFFVEQGQPYDWAWETFFVNGVKWRGKNIPEIPLVEPDKAATMPLEITFDRDYAYSLRGTDVVDGRDCWVVDFEPTAAAEGNRFQGTVWIDREHFLRVRSRALQLGLTGEVLSNEETLFYSPLVADGGLGEWQSASFTLPIRVVSQQIFSVLNATVNVEKETLLSQLQINAEGFDGRRSALYDSETTVVRDTDEGLRYLVEDKETGERVVQDEFDKNRLFLVGGAFYDESFDYPLPLAGVNWFSFDFRGTGTQANLFFAGIVALADIADPDLFGSRWDAGAGLFGVAIPFTNTIYRDGREAVEEDVELQVAQVEFSLGRPIGSYMKIGLEYELGLRNYSRADDTADEFVVPEDHLLHSLELSASYSRKGYRMRVAGDVNKRSDWEPWGLPGEPFDPETDQFTRWRASIAKTFSLSGFKKAGLEIEYLGGENLDRFSKYQFGYFADSRVHGYQSELIRAEEAMGLHTSYGFEVGELFRLDLIGDAVWATDEVSGLDNELLGGVGIAGTFIGPWQTIVNLDLGVPVAGPDDDGFTLFLAFLKLFG